MSRALAIFHGRFGRATVYQLNRSFNLHAHREGHLIFHLDGADGIVEVSGESCRLSSDAFVAINPWEPHNFMPTDLHAGSFFFVLYVNPEWFSTGDGTPLRFGRSRTLRTPGLDRQIQKMAAMVQMAASRDDLDSELHTLIEGCFEQSWRKVPDRGKPLPSDAHMDFRIKKSIRIMQNVLRVDIDLDFVARESGLSRPHFYRMFRSQTGITPNLYLNTLVMENAIEKLVTTKDAVADIGFGLGFSSQSGFGQFFAANVGMAPSDYRRNTHFV